MTFEIVSYTKSNIWKGNKYLVQPDGVKCCSICNRKWYSIEYAASDLYVDGKVPVCTKCARSQNKKDKIANLLKETTACGKCEKDKPLVEYLARKGDWYEVSNQCYDCRNERFLN